MSNFLRMTLFQSSRRTYLWAVFVLALLVRLAFVAFEGDVDHPLLYEHGEIAHNLFIGNGFTMHWPYQSLDSSRRAVMQLPIDHGGAFIPPLNPFIIYASYCLFGEGPTAVLMLMVFQSLLGACAIVLIYYLASLVSTDASARLVAIAASLYLPAAAAVTTFSGSAVYHLIGLAVLYLSIRIMKDGTMKLVLALGLCAGLMTTLRSEFMLLGAVLIFLAVVLSRSSVLKSHRIRSLVVVFVSFVAVLTPWTVRNYSLFDRLVPVVSHPWFEIWRGNNHVVAAESYNTVTWSWVNPVDFPELVHKMDAIPYDRHFEPAVNDLFHAEVLRFAESSPGAIVHLALEKILFFFTVDLSNPSTRAPLYILMTLPAIAAILYGLWRMCCERTLWTMAAIPLTFGAYYLVLTIATYTLPRYQIFVVLMLLPFAAVGLRRWKWLDTVQTVSGGQRR